MQKRVVTSIHGWISWLAVRELQRHSDRANIVRRNRQVPAGARVRAAGATSTTEAKRVGTPRQVSALHQDDGNASVLWPGKPGDRQLPSLPDRLVGLWRVCPSDQCARARSERVNERRPTTRCGDLGSVDGPAPIADQRPSSWCKMLKLAA